MPTAAPTNRICQRCNRPLYPTNRNSFGLCGKCQAEFGSSNSHAFRSWQARGMRREITRGTNGAPVVLQETSPLVPKAADVTPEDFVRAWQAATSVREVMDKTGYTYGTTQVRASRMRKMGIPLKRFKKYMDVPGLVKLATELAPKS